MFTRLRRLLDSIFTAFNHRYHFWDSLDSIGPLNVIDMEKLQEDWGRKSSEKKWHQVDKASYQGQWMLAQNSDLVADLNHEDSTTLQPACCSGNWTAAYQLTQGDPKLCLVKDEYGRTPLHTAVMSGRVDVMMELLIICPQSVLEVTTAKETPLHLAIRHDQEKALELLLGWIKDKSYFNDLINRQDCAGKTILHLATSRKHLQAIKFLLGEIGPCNAKVEVNAKTSGGFTALDILDVVPQHEKKDMEIEQVLRGAEALRAKDLSESILHYQGQMELSSPMKAKHRPFMNVHYAALVAATLIQTMTFLAALNVPGFRLNGVAFQIGKKSSHLMHLFILFDSIAFITSTVSIIIIVMRDLPLKPWLLVSVLSVFGAFTCSIMAVSPRDALSVLLLGSPPIMLAAVSRHLTKLNARIRVQKR